MNSLMIFKSNDFGNVRTLVDNNDKIYFVARDVAEILGYTKLDAMYRRLSDKQTLKINPQSIEITGFPQIDVTQLEPNPNIKTMVLITEGGLYKAIMGSILPNAEKFQDWVAEEVLPTIRKHGIYATDNVIDNILNNPDFGIELLTKLKEERKARIEAEKTNAILMHVNKTYTSTELAKEMGLKSAIALNKVLCEKGVQYKQNDTWVLYSKYSTCGYTEIKQKSLDNGRVIYDRHWTQLGRKFILELLHCDSTMLD